MQKIKQVLANRRTGQENNVQMGMIDNQANQLIQAMATLTPTFAAHTTVLPDPQLMTTSVLLVG